jgi:hypothetical protein
MVTLHRGFNIAGDNDGSVDDFMDSIEPTKTPDKGCKRIDAVRIAAARASACIMLLPVSLNSDQQLQNLKKMKATGSTAVVSMFALAPNRIQLKHLTASSRVRNLTHGGILGVLTRRLNRDPTQQKQWHQFNGALCVVQRANSTDGCAHVKWSMPEFQCAFNVGVKRHSTVQNHINEMDTDALVAYFNSLDTAEHRNTFLAECSAVAHKNQSRVVLPMDPDASAMPDWTAKRPVVLENTWIMDFMATFIKLCSVKMAAVNNSDAITIERCTSLVDLYRFIARIEWMVNDPNVRCVLSLNGFYAAHIKRLMYMATEGIEHSAYMLGRHCPEMMTPELHLRVVATPRFYRIPQMLIPDDDEVFGPMKVACQGFMPLMADPLPVSRQLHLYSDSDSDYYSDYTDDTTDIHDDDDDYDDDDDDDDDEHVSG